MFSEKPIQPTSLDEYKGEIRAHAAQLIELVRKVRHRTSHPTVREFKIPYGAKFSERSKIFFTRVPTTIRRGTRSIDNLAHIPPRSHQLRPFTLQDFQPLLASLDINQGSTESQTEAQLRLYMSLLSQFLECSTIEERGNNTIKQCRTAGQISFEKQDRSPLNRVPGLDDSEQSQLISWLNEFEKLFSDAIGLWQVEHQKCVASRIHEVEERVSFRSSGALSDPRTEGPINRAASHALGLPYGPFPRRRAKS